MPKVTKVRNRKLNYLFYVTFALSGLRVYRCNTDDPFHVMGEIVYREIEQITHITFVKETPEKLKFWENNKTKVEEWYQGELNAC